MILTSSILELCFFCQECEVLLGEESITLNMHLHGHEASCLRYYGPLYSFWLFSFERYNGYLGNFPNNGRSVEKQFMRTFLRDSYVNSINVSNDYKSQFVRSSARLQIEDSQIYLSPTMALEILDLADPHTLPGNQS